MDTALSISHKKELNYLMFKCLYFFSQINIPQWNSYKVQPGLSSINHDNKNKFIKICTTIAEILKST